MNALQQKVAVGRRIRAAVLRHESGYSSLLSTYAVSIYY